jgi:putative transposase
LGKRAISYRIQQNELPRLKEVFTQFRHVHSQVLQNVLRRADIAFGNFFERCERRKTGERIKAGYPRSKPSWRYNSFTYPQSGFKILPNGHLFLSKIGVLRVFMHRKITGVVKTLTVTRDRVGEWFVTINAEVTNLAPAEPKSAVGIDVGLKNPVTLSSRASRSSLRNCSRNLKGS